MIVFWSTTAELTFVEILQNIENRFTFKESENFNIEVFETISLIQKNPFMFEFFKRHYVRKAIIHPNTSLFYEVDEENKTIRLLTFFDNRMSQKLIEKLIF